MTQLNQIYKCNICGNIVEVVHVGVGQLVCCGEPMELLIEKTEDAGKEKHVPVIEQQGNELKVKIGEIPHPMEENHYIEWVEILCDKGCFKKSLKPGDGPEAFFVVDCSNYIVRIYCNVHGLWKSK
jgi:superoxide reductase